MNAVAGVAVDEVLLLLTLLDEDVGLPRPSILRILLDAAEAEPEDLAGLESGGK